MLTTLAVTNWRGRTARHSLGKHTLVVGPPQSGKTGVLDAIEYLLFDATRNGKGTRGQSEFVSGATALVQGDTGSVTITRDAEGKLKAVRVGERSDGINTRAELEEFHKASPDKRREWLVRMIGAETVLALGKQIAEARIVLNGLRKKKQDHEAANRVSAGALAAEGRAPDAIKRDIDTKTKRREELAGIIARVKALQESRQPIVDELTAARTKLSEAEASLAATPKPTADIAALEKAAQGAADALKVIDGFIASLNESKRQSGVEKRRAEERLARVDHDRARRVGAAARDLSDRFSIPDDDESWSIVLEVVNQAFGLAEIIMRDTADAEIAAYDTRLAELDAERQKAQTAERRAYTAFDDAFNADKAIRDAERERNRFSAIVKDAEARLDKLDSALGEHTAGVEPYEAEASLLATELTALNVEWTEATNARAAAASSAKAAQECAALDKQITDKKAEIEALDKQRATALAEHVDPIRESMRHFLDGFNMAPAIKFGDDGDFIGLQLVERKDETGGVETRYFAPPIPLDTLSGCETLVFGLALLDAVLRQRGGLLMMDAELLPHEWLAAVLRALDDAPYQVILSAYDAGAAYDAPDDVGGWTIVEAR